MYNKHLIDDIYRLTNKVLVEPSELLDNLKIDGYKDINYKKVKGNLVCSLSFDDGVVRAVFQYLYDENNRLMKIKAIESNETTELFNRKVELNNKLNEFDSYQANCERQEA